MNSRISSSLWCHSLFYFFRTYKTSLKRRAFPVIHQGVVRFGRPSGNSPNIDEWMNGRDGHQPNNRGFIYPVSGFPNKGGMTISDIRISDPGTSICLQLYDTWPKAGSKVVVVYQRAKGATTSQPRSGTGEHGFHSGWCWHTWYVEGALSDRETGGELDRTHSAKSSKKLTFYLKLRIFFIKKYSFGTLRRLRQGKRDLDQEHLSSLTVQWM